MQDHGPKIRQQTLHFSYTFEDMQRWLGWQARVLILDFLNEAKTVDCTLDVFAFDLNETTVCDTLIKFGAESPNKVENYSG